MDTKEIKRSFIKEKSIKIQGFFDKKVFDYLETRDIIGTLNLL